MTKQTFGNMEGKAEAIVLTFSQDFFKEHAGGEPEVRRLLERMNESDDHYWCQTVGSGLPKIEVKYAYLVWAGKIQYRCDIQSFAAKQTLTFPDGRKLRNKNWAFLVGPVVTPPHDMPMKGFQGFRYSEYLF